MCICGCDTPLTATPYRPLGIRIGVVGTNRANVTAGPGVDPGFGL